ncbi:hypothetical protein DPX82_26640 [Salmonella enterica]|nr:hypothetical protein [Salmonella enterica]EBS3851056.1 hypothetical protein [Salmonella enterica subsp. enterica serovar Java]EAP7758098.1 hypothetical protein [Salmonella enterica]EAR3735231.1 hypothetical protein [Salmonella enterica]EBI2965324.1 hypothetical protein [Salmonella enterica]
MTTNQVTISGDFSVRTLYSLFSGVLPPDPEMAAQDQKIETISMSHTLDTHHVLKLPDFFVFLLLIRG